MRMLRSASLGSSCWQVRAAETRRLRDALRDCLTREFRSPRSIRISMPVSRRTALTLIFASAMVLHAKAERLLTIEIPRRWTTPSSRVTTFMGTPTAVG